MLKHANKLIAKPATRMSSTAGSQHKGRVGYISQVIGAVVDVHFAEGVPPVLTALEVKEKLGRDETLTLEIVQHLDANTGRCIAMQTTDLLKLKARVESTGDQISVPVGRETLGRIFNVLGEAIDQRGPVGEKVRMPIHAVAPQLSEQSAQDTVLTTGIKVIDLILPYCKGAQDWAVRWGRCRENSHHHGAHQQHCKGPRRLLRVCGRGRAHAGGDGFVPGDDAVGGD